MALQPALEIRKKLGHQIAQPGAGHAGSPVGHRHAHRSAHGRIISIGKASAHGRAKHVCPVKRGSARIEASDDGAADRVSDTGPQLMRIAPAPIASVLMKRGSEYEVAPKILAGDIPDRRSEALGIGRWPGVPSIERSGSGCLRHGGIESAGAKRERRYRLALEILPLFGYRRRSQRDG